MCEVGRVIGCGLLSFIQFGNVAVWNTFGYFALRHSNLVRADVWLRRLPTRQRFVNGIGKRYLLPTPSEQIIVPAKNLNGRRSKHPLQHRRESPSTNFVPGSQWPAQQTPTATGSVFRQSKHWLKPMSCEHLRKKPMQQHRL